MGMLYHQLQIVHMQDTVSIAYEPQRIDRRPRRSDAGQLLYGAITGLEQRPQIEASNRIEDLAKRALIIEYVGGAGQVPQLATPGVSVFTASTALRT